MTIVGKNIRRIRRSKSISVTAVAVGLGITYQQMRNYETGRSRITEQVISKAAEILDVPVGELFLGDGDAEATDNA